MTVRLEQHGAVRVIELNRPDKANSMNAALNAALGAAFADAAADDAVRVVVLTAAGDRHFCAGMDLSEFAAGATASAVSAPGVTLFTEAGYAKPVIGAINGAAVGGGFGLALACDILLAAENATFGIPEVKHGLVGVGVSSRAVGRLPLPVVLRMALTGEALDARTAHALHLVAEVLPRADLLPRALEMAERIAGFDPRAVAAAKDVVLSAAAVDSPDMAELRGKAAHVVRGSGAKDGAAAFAARPRT